MQHLLGKLGSDGYIASASGDAGSGVAGERVPDWGRSQCYVDTLEEGA